MAWISLDRHSAGGLLNEDASGLVQSRLLTKEAEVEMGQLVHPPSGGHVLPSVGESGHLLGRMIHW